MSLPQIGGGSSPRQSDLVSRTVRPSTGSLQSIKLVLSQNSKVVEVSDRIFKKSPRDSLSTSFYSNQAASNKSSEPFEQSPVVPFKSLLPRFAPLSPKAPISKGFSNLASNERDHLDAQFQYFRSPTAGSFSSMSENTSLESLSPVGVYVEGSQKSSQFSFDIEINEEFEVSEEGLSLKINKEFQEACAKLRRIEGRHKVLVDQGQDAFLKKSDTVCFNYKELKNFSILDSVSQRIDALNKKIDIAIAPQDKVKCIQSIEREIARMQEDLPLLKQGRMLLKVGNQAEKVHLYVETRYEDKSAFLTEHDNELHELYLCSNELVKKSGNLSLLPILYQYSEALTNFRVFPPKANSIIKLIHISMTEFYANGSLESKENIKELAKFGIHHYTELKGADLKIEFFIKPKTEDQRKVFLLENSSVGELQQLEVRESPDKLINAAEMLKKINPDQSTIGLPKLNRLVHLGLAIGSQRSGNIGLLRHPSSRNYQSFVENRKLALEGNQTAAKSLAGPIFTDCLQLVLALKTMHDKDVYNPGLSFSDISTQRAENRASKSFGYNLVLSNFTEATYMSRAENPEIAKTLSQNDIFKLGCLLFTIVENGQSPFGEGDIDHSSPLKPVNKEIPKDVRKCISKMISPDPKKRPTAAEVKELFVSYLPKYGESWTELSLPPCP